MRFVIIISILLTLLMGCSEIKPDKGNGMDFSKYWQYQDPAATHRELDKLLEETPLDDKLVRAEILTQMARARGLQQRFEDGEKYLMRALKLIGKNDKSRAYMRYLLEYGRLRNTAGDAKAARISFLTVWDKARQYNYPFLAVDAAHMMAIVEEPDKQLGWSEKAIEYIESSENKRVSGWLGPLYNNTAWTYHDLGQYDKAMNLFEKGLEFRKSRNDTMGVLIAEWTIARCYRSLNQIDKAKKLQLKLEKEFIDYTGKPYGYVYEELMEIAILEKDEANTKEYAKKAYEILSKDAWTVNNEKNKLDRFKSFFEGK